MTNATKAIRDALREDVIEKYYMFDRVRFSVYDLSKKRKLKRVLKRLRKQGLLNRSKLTAKRMIGRTVPIGFIAELFQPTQQALSLIDEVITDSKVNLSYVEFTLALITRAMSNAKHLQRALSTNMVTPRIKYDAHDVPGKYCTYFGSFKYNENGEPKRVPARVLACYVRRDKLTDRPCVHVELRVKGKSKLIADEFLTLGELADANISDVLKNHVKFYKLKAKQEVGDAIRQCKGDESVTDRMNRNIFDDYFEGEKFKAFKAQHLYHNFGREELLNPMPINLFA